MHVFCQKSVIQIRIFKLKIWYLIWPKKILAHFPSYKNKNPARATTKKIPNLKNMSDKSVVCTCLNLWPSNLFSSCTLFPSADSKVCHLVCFIFFLNYTFVFKSKNKRTDWKGGIVFKLLSFTFNIPLCARQDHRNQQCQRH